MLLELNGSYFQLDTVIISGGVIHLIDTKNYSDDYFWENGKLYFLSTKKECKNPVEQLNRGLLLFKQLLHSLKLNYLVEAFAIFIHPEFTLYQAPTDLPIIHPTQVKRFIDELDKTKSVLNDGHKKLAQALISLNQPKNPFEKLPEYKYEQLRKGIFSKCCETQLFVVNLNRFLCLKCGESEKIEDAIIRNVNEYKFLFPDRKITTSSIQEWCQTGLSKRTITRVLKKHFTAFGNTSNTFYK
nr:nuclease-related domain-containing protein [Neobacillus notoginsengisoli]